MTSSLDKKEDIAIFIDHVINAKYENTNVLKYKLLKLNSPLVVVIITLLIKIPLELDNQEIKGRYN